MYILGSWLSKIHREVSSFLTFMLPTLHFHRVFGILSRMPFLRRLASMVSYASILAVVHSLWLAVKPTYALQLFSVPADRLAACGKRRTVRHSCLCRPL